MPKPPFRTWWWWWSWRSNQGYTKMHGQPTMKKNQYDNNANFVFRDTVPTLYQGVSVKCHGFSGTNINVISYTPVTKLRPFLCWTSPWNLQMLNSITRRYFTPNFTHMRQYSHASFNDGDTSSEIRRETISSLCERHRSYLHKSK